MRTYLIVLAAVSVLTACSAALVPASSDPGVKLDQARQLLGINRAIPAERLIREAMAIYEDRKDIEGLAGAKMLYGVMLQTDVYRSYEKVWTSAGKYDPTAKSAIRYMEAALGMYGQANSLSGQRWASLELAKAYFPENEKDKACVLLKQVSTYNELIEKSGKNMGAESAGDHFKRWDEMTRRIKTSYGCL